MAMVKLFGAIGDVAGWAEKAVPGATLGEILAEIANEDERLAEHLGRPSTLVIVDNTLIPHSLRRSDMAIGADDELAFGSPVSGG